MERRYKKWSELTFWERIGRDKSSYEHARKEAEAEEQNRRCAQGLGLCLCKTFILIIALLSLLAPYYFIYIGSTNDEIKIMGINIGSSVVYTFIMIAVYCPRCCDCVGSCCFRAFFCIMNSITIICDGLSIYIFLNDNAYSKKTEFYESGDFNIIIAAFNIIFCLIFYCVICKMYQIKKLCEEEQMNLNSKLDVGNLYDDNRNA